MNKNKSVKVFTAILENLSKDESSESVHLWSEEEIAEALYDGLTAQGIRLEQP